MEAAPVEENVDTVSGSDKSGPVTDHFVRNQDDDLPKNFDVLIVGTGLVESIVSAAVSRNGHTVLHIDPRDYYGGTYGTFGLDQWTSLNFTEVPQEAKDVEITLSEKSKGKVVWRNNVTNCKQIWYDDREATRTELMTKQRRFNIDLMPKLIAAREDIIELLITSNVSRYLEFLRVTRILTNFPSPNQNQIESIPLSRADIFTSKCLTLVEKRNLVKLIESVLKPKLSAEEEGEAEENPNVPETFDEIVKFSKASDKLRHMVKSSVTILDDGYSPDGERFNQEFCSRCRLFLNSIGRYQNQTPFLWTIYGISEICQAFCRLSAVYGGIFILKRHLSSIDATEDGYTVKTGDGEIKFKHIVLGPDMECDISGKERSKKEQTSINVGRAVLITKGGNIKPPDGSVKSKGDGIYLYRISGLEVIEMNHSSNAVPKDYHLLQISFPLLENEADESSCRNFVESRLMPFVDFKIKKLPSDSTESSLEVVTDSKNPEDTETKSTEDIDRRPQVIYGSYFTLKFQSNRLFSGPVTTTEENNSKFCVMESGIASTDITSYVSKAREIFSSLYPGEEFLPKAPDVEETEEMLPEEEDLNELNANPEAVGGTNDNSNENSELISPSDEDPHSNPSLESQEPHAE